MSVGTGPLTYASGTVPAFVINNSGSSADNFQYMPVVTTKSSFPSAYQTTYGVAVFLPATAPVTPPLQFQLLLYSSANYGGTPATYQLSAYYPDNSFDANGISAYISGTTGIVRINLSALHPLGVNVSSWKLVTNNTLVQASMFDGGSGNVTGKIFMTNTGGYVTAFTASSTASMTMQTIANVAFSVVA